MDENVSIGIIRGNEAKTLFRVKPFDGSLCHLPISFIAGTVPAHLVPVVVTEAGSPGSLPVRQFLQEQHARNRLASMKNTYTKTGYSVTYH
ncbi:hypothetical protein GCM10009688_19600 [Arthrobacter gandavensis]|uniref:Uncharacterized protein n=1 Tax=Arthrobacter gandavensis TaxID=169960 RepID=A0ABN2PB41_9MICC